LARKSLTFGALAAAIATPFLIDARADRREAEAVAAFPPLGQFIEVDGRQVHVHVSGSGPDLVLIHGAGGNMRDFLFQFVGRLSDRYRVIVFDRPGFGYSERTNPAYLTAFGRDAESPAEQASLLRAAALHLGAENPIVVGHSYGGAVAYAWAVYHPENIAGVVSLAGVTLPWPGDIGPYYTVPGSRIGGAVIPPLVSAFVTTERVAEGIQGTFHPNQMPEGYDSFIGGALTVRRDSFRANARQVNGLRPHVVAQSEHYARLDLPVTMVHGDADTTVPLDVHSRPASEIIPGAELVVLEGVGHMPHHIDPDAAIAAIDSTTRRAGLR